MNNQLYYSSNDKYFLSFIKLWLLHALNKIKSWLTVKIYLFSSQFFLSNYRWTKISKMCSSHGLTGIRVSAIDGSNLLSSENGINPKGER